jgi:hypothetical protein
MQSIVLTFDRQLEVANLVVESYNRLWPGCPLVFRIPYQDRPVRDLFRAPNICFVKTPRAIRATMEHLLQGCADEEFVYWCVDDRFPVCILDPDALHVACDVISAGGLALDALRMGGLSPTARQQGAQDKTRPLVIGKARFFPQRGKMQFGFYMPQFIRARVLREYSLHSDLPVDYGIRDFHDWLKGQCVRHRIYTPERFVIQLGESTTRGALTPNCLARIVAMGLPRPDLPVCDRNVSYGGEFEPLLGLS